MARALGLSRRWSSPSARRGRSARIGQGSAQVGAYAVDVVDRLGAGDAFVAGFLAARLRGRALADGLRYGAALSALSMTIPSDLALVSEAEVEALLTSGGATIRR